MYDNDGGVVGDIIKCNNISRNDKTGYNLSCNNGGGLVGNNSANLDCRLTNIGTNIEGLAGNDNTDNSNSDNINNNMKRNINNNNNVD